MVTLNEIIDDDDLLIHILTFLVSNPPSPRRLHKRHTTSTTTVKKDNHNSVLGVAAEHARVQQLKQVENDDDDTLLERDFSFASWITVDELSLRNAMLTCQRWRSVVDSPSFWRRLLLPTHSQNNNKNNSDHHDLIPFYSCFRLLNQENRPSLLAYSKLRVLSSFSKNSTSEEGEGEVATTITSSAASKSQPLFLSAAFGELVFLARERATGIVRVLKTSYRFDLSQHFPCQLIQETCARAFLGEKEMQYDHNIDSESTLHSPLSPSSSSCLPLSTVLGPGILIRSYPDYHCLQQQLGYSDDTTLLSTFAPIKSGTTEKLAVPFQLQEQPSQVFLNDFSSFSWIDQFCNMAAVGTPDDTSCCIHHRRICHLLFLEQQSKLNKQIHERFRSFPSSSSLFSSLSSTQSTDLWFQEIKEQRANISDWLLEIVEVFDDSYLSPTLVARTLQHARNIHLLETESPPVQSVLFRHLRRLGHYYSDAVSYTTTTNNTAMRNDRQTWIAAIFFFYSMTAAAASSDQVQQSQQSTTTFVHSEASGDRMSSRRRPFTVWDMLHCTDNTLSPLEFCEYFISILCHSFCRPSSTIAVPVVQDFLNELLAMRKQTVFHHHRKLQQHCFCGGGGGKENNQSGGGKIKNSKNVINENSNEKETFHLLDSMQNERLERAAQYLSELAMMTCIDYLYPQSLIASAIYLLAHCMCYKNRTEGVAAEPIATTGNPIPIELWPKGLNHLFGYTLNATISECFVPGVQRHQGAKPNERPNNDRKSKSKPQFHVNDCALGLLQMILQVQEEYPGLQIVQRRYASENFTLPSLASLTDKLARFQRYHL